MVSFLRVFSGEGNWLGLVKLGSTFLFDQNICFRLPDGSNAYYEKQLFAINEFKSCSRCGYVLQVLNG